MTDYSRGDYADLPAGKTDLENNYTAPDLTAIASNDNSTYAEQTANNEIAIHQYKKTVTGQYTNITWSGKSSLAPSESPVVLEVYNVTGTAWEELDRDDSTAADTDFDIIYNNLATADYLDSGVITWRVYQSASADSGCIALYYFENNWNDSKGSYTLTPVNNPTFGTTTPPQGSYYAQFSEPSHQYAKNTSLHLPSPCTICFWIYLPVATEFGQGLIGNQMQWAGTGFGLYISGVNIVANDSGNHTLGGINAAIWAHVGVTLDESTHNWEIFTWDATNGPATISGSTLTGTYDASNEFRIGSFADVEVTNSLTANLDEVCIFNRILSSTEIDLIRTGDFTF